MKFFRISKPEIRIDILIDEIGDDAPSKKYTEQSQVAARESSGTQEKNRRKSYKTSKKQYLHFFKSSELRKQISKRHRYSWNIQPRIRERYDEEEERERDRESSL